MSKKISLKLKSDDNIEKTIQFQFSPELQMGRDIKSTVVFFTFFVENEEIGILETSFEDFNNFCLDLFNEHKNIMANHK